MRNVMERSEGMATKTIIIVFAFPLFMNFLTGCTSVKSLLNIEPVSSADQRQRAIDANSDNLMKFKSCDFIVNLGEYDFDSLLVPAINKFASEKRTINHVQHLTIGQISLVNSQEQINMSTDIQITLDTLDASVDGNLIGTISFVVRNDSLIFFPAFTHIHVNDLSYKNTGNLETKAIAFVINLGFDAFIDRLNGYITSRVPLGIPLNLLDWKISSNELMRDPKTTVTLSHPLEISTRISSTSCLIDENGIHILGKLNNAPNTAPPYVDTITQHRKEDFDVFQRDFTTKTNNFFPGAPEDRKTFVMFSKSCISNILNNALDSEIVTVSYGPDSSIAGKIDKHMDIDIGDIDCGKIGNALHGDCEAAKAALRFMGNKISIGDIHVTVSSIARGDATILGISLSRNLSNINLSLQGDANAAVNTTFGFTPEGMAGKLICSRSFDHPFSCGVDSGAVDSQSMTVATSFDSSVKDMLLMKFQTSPLTVRLTFDPTPLQLIGKFIPTLTDCPIFVSLVNLTSRVHDLFAPRDVHVNLANAILNGKYDYPVNGYTLSFPIKPVHIAMQDKEIVLHPVNKDTYIGFYTN
jgi:hypothetical protein